MAKVKLPLVSLEARGQIGKALVYFPWKGVNAVREYVIPTNPRTPDQLTQRGYLGDAVQAWHDASYTADDHTAWERYATTLAKPMTGFNSMVRRYITVRLIPKTWQALRDLAIDTTASTIIALSVHSDEIATPPLVWTGLTKTFFYKTTAMSYLPGPDRWVVSVSGLTPKTQYFFYVVQTPPGIEGYTGITSAKTT